MADNNLINKNVVLISPCYFGYELEIQKELQKKGAYVYFIDDRIKNSTINKAIFRLNLLGKRSKKNVWKYFNDHLERLAEKKIDFLIAIIPEGFNKEIIKHYKSKLKDTVFILYMWDSIENRPYILDTLDLYNYTYTFDRNNSEIYGLNFKPLFYTDEYASISLEVPQYKYDVSFIGTAHSDRYYVINKLVKSASRSLSGFFFFYLQHPALILYYRLTDSKFKGVKAKDLSFKGLSKQEVIDIITMSRCVIDINHPKQTGLTIRTLEVLGACRKLITTNQDIINYDFYNPRNILLIDRLNPKLIPEFLKSSYEMPKYDIYKKYSLSSWIDHILNI